MRWKRYLLIIIIFALFIIKPNTFLAHPTSPEQLKFQQLSAQISYFQDALNEFGATTPTQVIELWSRGYDTRNGVYPYSVSCQNLKKSMEEKLGKANKNFWIIGGSSPWLSKYKIIEQKQVNNNSYLFNLQYAWSTSFKDDIITKETLYVMKERNYWCVHKQIKSNSNEKVY